LKEISKWGYGFGGGTDVFVHISAVEKAGYTNLVVLAQSQAVSVQQANALHHAQMCEERSE